MMLHQGGAVNIWALRCGEATSSCHLSERMVSVSVTSLFEVNSAVMVEPKMGEVCVGRMCGGDNFQSNHEVPDPELQSIKQERCHLVFCTEVESANVHETASHDLVFQAWASVLHTSQIVLMVHVLHVWIKLIHIFLRSIITKITVLIAEFIVMACCRFFTKML